MHDHDDARCDSHPTRHATPWPICPAGQPIAWSRPATTSVVCSNRVNSEWSRAKPA
jgi:hypothetical protein